MNYSHVALILSGLMLGGCIQPRAADVTGAGSQLEIRQMQSREYDTLDKRMTMRAAIATLQDLGFVIDTADIDLGTITATRLDKLTMRMTVTVRDGEGKRVSVRVNARVGDTAVKDQATYQDFFVNLDKAMFLVLNKVD
jgi:hypothetical protein